MHIRHLIIIALPSGTLVACGGGKQPVPGSGLARTSQATPSLGDASAEQVVAQARGDMHCPAGFTANPPGAPVDDIVGVRPGMSYEQAAQVVMCSNPLLVVTPENSRGFDMQTYGQKLRQGFTARFAEPRVHKTGRQIMQDMEHNAMDRGMNAVRHDLKPGQSKWFVSSMGMPGKEKVISAAREQWFEEGRNPTIASVEQSLIAKYGVPTRKMDHSGYHMLSWAYDPQGQRISATSPSFSPCWNAGTADPDASVSLSTDCGIVIEAIVNELRDNPALGQYLQVGVVDKAGGYRLLTDTGHGLQAMDAARRARQVREASKNAQAPQL